MLKLGAVDISTLKVGGADIARAYQGTTLVHEAVTAARPWRPTDLQSVSLEGWYALAGGAARAEALTLQADSGIDRVTAWADQSGKGRTLLAPSEAGAPSYEIITGYNMRVVRMDGNGRFLRIAAGLGYPLGRVGCFVAMVVQGQFGGNARLVSMNAAGGPDFAESGMIPLIQNSAEVALYKNGFGPPSVIPLDAPHILGAYPDTPSSYRIAHNGVAAPDALMHGTPSEIDAVALGSQSHSPGSYARAGFCEAVFFAGTLSLSDRQKLEGYLAHTNALAGQLPAEHPFKASPPLA